MIIFALIFGVLGGTAQAQNLCTFTADETAILRTIEFRSASGGSVDFCRPNSFARKVLDGLLFIKARHWQASGGDEFDQGLLPSEPMRFLTPRVKQIILDNANSELCGASVGARNINSSGVINICPAVMNINVFEIATVLIHEARHTDGAGFLHVNCEGRLNIEGGSCDPSYESGGAYAAGTEFAIKVSRDPTVSTDMRNFARGFALQELYVRFVTKPFGIRPMVALEGADGGVTMFDGASAYGFGLKLNPAALKLTVRAHELKIFDAGRGTSVDIVHEDSYFSARDALSKYYSSTLSSVDRARVIDFSFGANYSCVLFPESFRCIDEQGNLIQDLRFTTFKAKSFLDVSQSSNDREGILYIVGDDGATHVLPGQARGLMNLRVGDLERNGVPSGLINLSILGDAQVALLGDGSVLKYSPVAKSWSKIPSLGGSRFIKLMGTVFWSERLQKLKDEPKTLASRLP